MQPLLVLKQLEHNVVLVQQLIKFKQRHWMLFNHRRIWIYIYCNLMLISTDFSWNDEVSVLEVQESLTLHILYTL